MCITLFNTIYLYILLNIVSSESFFLLKNYLQAGCTSCRGVAHATISDPWWKLLGCWDEESPDVWAADCPFCLLLAKIIGLSSWMISYNIVNFPADCRYLRCSHMFAIQKALLSNMVYILSHPAAPKQRPGCRSQTSFQAGGMQCSQKRDLRKLKKWWKLK
jgi:hypothetical protein